MFTAQSSVMPIQRGTFRLVSIDMLMHIVIRGENLPAGVTGLKRRRIKRHKNGRIPYAPNRFETSRTMFTQFYRPDFKETLPSAARTTKNIRQVLLLHWESASPEIKRVCWLYPHFDLWHLLTYFCVSNL